MNIMNHYTFIEINCTQGPEKYTDTKSMAIANFFIFYYKIALNVLHHQHMIYTQQRLKCLMLYNLVTEQVTCSHVSGETWNVQLVLLFWTMLIWPRRRCVIARYLGCFPVNQYLKTADTRENIHLHMSYMFLCLTYSISKDIATTYATTHVTSEPCSIVCW